MQKMDIFKRKMWYSYHSEPSHFIELNLDKVQEIVSQNKKGEQPDSLEIFVQAFVEEPKHDYENVVGQDSITRFDTQKGKKSNKKRKSKTQNERQTHDLKTNYSHKKLQPKAVILQTKAGKAKKNRVIQRDQAQTEGAENGQKNSANRSKKNEENKSE